MKRGVPILLVDDDSVFRHVMSGELRRFGYDVVAVGTGEDAIKQAALLEPEVVLLDLRLPTMNGLDVLKQIRSGNSGAEVIMLTGHGSIDTAIESIRVGAFDYVVKPCALDELQVRIQRAIDNRSLRQRATLLERGLTPPDLGSSFLGESTEFRRLLHLVERVAPSDATVLISGETGSGKERVAKLIHARSVRSTRPFIVVECAALQESLLQSELFGHERGAFTGADRLKHGLFEVAHGGTIFLDEIGEVSPAIQTKLLRVLDTSTFRRMGSTSEVRVDVRVIAATNRDVSAMVRQGLFREDLYYRLSTLRIEIPPLRSRGADLELLARHFVAVFNERFGVSKKIGDDSLRILKRHSWPGNVRELLHVVEASMIVCEGAEILPEHFPLSLRTPGANGSSVATAEGDAFPTLQELESAHIKLALHKARGHRANAARMLGISERNLYRRLREHKLVH